MQKRYIFGLLTTMALGASIAFAAVHNDYAIGMSGLTILGGLALIFGCD